MKTKLNRDVQTKPRLRLIELRKSFGTQREVAAALGISETYLRLLEKGNATPSVELMFKIAHYFKTDVYDCWKDLSGDRPNTNVCDIHN